MRERAVVISSTIPSAKYSCSGSPLRLRNGSTASDGSSATGALGSPAVLSAAGGGVDGGPVSGTRLTDGVGCELGGVREPVLGMLVAGDGAKLESGDTDR